MKTATATNAKMGFLRFDEEPMKSLMFSHKISNWIRIRSVSGGLYDILVLLFIAFSRFGLDSLSPRRCLSNEPMCSV